MTKTSRVLLAVLALCGTSAALAQSSVTLYGRVNTTVEHQKFGNASATGMVSNSSYIGFKGVEDLGGGLKAGFILESRFNSDDGSGSAGGINFTRQSEVNLSGNFGMVRLGNFDPASLYAISDPVSMHNHDTGTSADALAGNYLGTSNKIAYVTPSFGGFTAEVQYQFGEKRVDNSYEDKGGWDLALNYGNGPLALGLGYSHAKFEDLLGSDDLKARQFGGYAAYEFGAFTLAGYYQKQKNYWGSDNYSRNVYRLAGKYVVGASEFHANVGKASSIRQIGADSTTQWTLAYNYNLSKRTKLYALYTNLNHADSAAYNPASFSLDTANTSSSDKFRAFGIGVRHLF